MYSISKCVNQIKYDENQAKYQLYILFFNAYFIIFAVSVSVFIDLKNDRVLEHSLRRSLHKHCNSLKPNGIGVKNTHLYYSGNIGILILYVISAYHGFLKYVFDLMNMKFQTKNKGIIFYEI